MKIGPTFSAELTAAGIPIGAVTWDTEAGTILSAPAEWSAAAAAVLAAHDPAKPLPASIPDISDSQFAQGLWRAGIIPYADVLAFAGPGKIPDRLLAIIAQLPDDDTGQPTPRKLATADLTGRKVYQFANPLVEYVRVAMEKQDPKWTPDYLRQQWLLWATL